MYICAQCLELFEDDGYALPDGTRCEKCFVELKEAVDLLAELWANKKDARWEI